MGMQLLRFAIYRDDNGNSPYKEWLNGLPRPDRAKMEALIRKIEQTDLSYCMKMQWVKKVDDDIWEIRSKRSSNIQRACYFYMSGSQCVITHGFTKKTQKMPPKELKRAHRIRNIVLDENENKRSN